MIEFFFFGKPIKTLGSLGKIRVGRVTRNTHIFFLALPHIIASQKIWQFSKSVHKTGKERFLEIY